MKKAYSKHLFSLLLFGSNGIVAGHIALSSYEIVLLRTLIGSLLLLGLFVTTKQRFACTGHPKQLLFIALSGMAMGGSWMFLYEAYSQIGVGIATLAYYCGPVIVVALSPVLFGEKLTPVKIFEFSAVLCGILLLNLEALQVGRNSWGLFCGGMSALLYAGMVIANKKARDITGMENATLQLLAGFGTVALLVGARQGLSIAIAPTDWLPILLLGLLNTGIGCYLYFSSIGQLPVQTVALLGYLEPLSALLFAALLLGEQMNALQLTGAVLILGGAITAKLIAFRREYSKADAPRIG